MSISSSPAARFIMPKPTILDSRGKDMRSKNSVEDLANDYRLTPATLYNRLDPNWIPKEFLLKASMKIAQTIAKPNGRLIISWPPRHGKSRLGTIASPIWALENYPTKNIILATYGADLSTDFGREVRDIFNRNQHLLRERIRPDVKSVGRFMTTKGGGMLNVGLGGGITGKGADLFIIDDYIKTMEEAQNMSTHEKHWEWFTGTAYHRLEPNASLIIIATRWHHRDLIGRMLREFPEWDHIKFQAIAKENDILGREPGEALFPERYDIEALEDRKRVLGTYYFNAIFQQEPTDDTAKLTDRDWIEIVEAVPTHNQMKFARIWDFAGTKGGGDYTVGSLIAVDLVTRHIYVIDVFRKQVSPQSIENAVRVKAEDDGVETEIVMEQEPGASGKQIVTHYEVNVLPEFKVSGSPTTTSKTMRAQPFLAAAEAGKVHILRRTWNKDFLDEFEDFPDGNNDDQVDTVAIGYNKLLSKVMSSVVWGRRAKGLTNAEVNRTGTGRHAKKVTGSVWGRKPRSRGAVGVPGMNSPEVGNYTRTSGMILKKSIPAEVEDAEVIE